jgi:hypothetical protein
MAIACYQVKSRKLPKSVVGLQLRVTTFSGAILCEYRRRDAHFAALQSEPVRQTEKIEQGEKIAPTVTVEETPGQKLRRRIEQERQRQQQQRRSGGIRI